MTLSVQLQFIAARNFTKLDKPRKIDLIVIHSMEAPEASTTAIRVATWFAGKDAPKASAHFCVDNENIIQCVADNDVAWHAPGANSNGIGIEHAGFARQTIDEWNDDFSRSMLELSAQLSADLCVKYGIPPLSLDAEALKAGKRGITTHKAVTDAFNGGKGHWDPGPGFPMANYCTRVAELMVSDMPSEFDPYTLSTYGIVEASNALRGSKPE